MDLYHSTKKWGFDPVILSAYDFPATKRTLTMLNIIDAEVEAWHKEQRTNREGQNGRDISWT